MAPDLFSAVWSLPGPRLFLQQIGQGLSNGISMLVLFPTGRDPSGFRRQLFHHLEVDRYLRVRMVDLSPVDGATPFDVMRSFFPEAGECQYLEQMVDFAALPDVIFLEQLEQCSPSQKQSWLDAVARWTDACHSSGSIHSLILATCSPDVSGLRFPPADVRLSYQVWAGIPSILEMRLLCRMQNDEMDAEGQWREYMLSSLAGNDLRLGETLWEVVCLPVENILERLQHFAAEQRWEKDDIDRLFRRWRPTPPGVDLRLAPGESGFELISQGLTVYTPEYGEEIHSAVLALLGRERDIIHRIWRAQASLLLPLIDDVRLRICDYMTAKNLKQFGSPIELSELKNYFENISSSSWEKRQWESGICTALQIRNALAHYTPIPYDWYRDFWFLSQSVHRMLFQV